MLLLAARRALRASRPALAAVAASVVWQEQAARSNERFSLTISDLREGTGARARAGDWVSVHFVIRLLGDGSVVEETRSSGRGSRTYGEPYQFLLGRVEDKDVLRAFHPGVLDMREGGTRRVRLCVADPDFGYREQLKLMDPRKWGLTREVGADWILDIEITLVAVAEKRPARWPWERTLATDAASK